MRTDRILTAAVLSLLCVSSLGAETRFEAHLRGGLVLTGNALGLSKEAGANGPGTADSIGALITPDESSVDQDPANLANPWFTGTTNSWQDNGSAAVLDLPNGATVRHAELFWGGSVYDSTVRGLLGSAVTISFEGRSGVSVFPDSDSGADVFEPAASSGRSYDVYYYLRSAEVTDYVDSHGAGTYTVSGVPATESTALNSLNAAGWALAVVYDSASDPMRYVSLILDGSFVDENSSSTVSAPGVFTTPASGAAHGSLFLAALEGDANRGGDQALIGADTSDLTALSGPNNPVDNFFASQINKGDESLDTRGTFGDRNHAARTSGTAATANVVGARQGWDVTTIRLSDSDGTLENAQDSLVLRLTDVGDAYVPVLAGVAVDVPGPDLSVTTRWPDGVVWNTGEEVLFSIDIENLDPTTDASAVLLDLGLPDGFEIAELTVDGAAKPVPTGAKLAALGTIDALGATSASISVRMSEAPNASSVEIAPSFEYDFKMAATQSAVTTTMHLASESVAVNHPPEPPQLVTPENGAPGLATKLQLIWDETTDADGDTVEYRVFISEDAGFADAQPIVVSSRSDQRPARFVALASLGFGLLSLGAPRFRRWRVLLVLAIALILIACPAPVGPGDTGPGAGNADDEQSIEEPQDQDVTFDPPPEGRLGHILENLDPDTEYFWKVEAVDSRGGVSSSATWSFRTDP